MKSILIKDGSTELYLGEAPDPIMANDEILVRVKATALNRADLLQKRGLYPPPAGASTIIGLEMAGVVENIGSDVTNWKIGDRVFGLLSGGGYAQYTTIPAAHAMPIPDELSFEEAAAIPEAYLTAYLGIVQLARLKSGDIVLIHAGASGVGSAAIQIAKELGATAIATCGGAKKRQVISTLGAALVIDYKTESFVEKVKAFTNNRGVDIILDCVGASYFQDNINSLAIDGRLVIIGTMGGNKADGVNLSDILRRRLEIIGTALRSRSKEFKTDLTQRFAEFALPRLADDRLVPVIEHVYSWSQVNQAHAEMEANRNTGKLILKID